MHSEFTYFLEMQLQWFILCFMLIQIIFGAPGVNGEFITMGIIAVVGLCLYNQPTIFEDIKNSKALNGVGGGEACTGRFISSNFALLEADLKDQVHGQELAISYITAALKNHFQHRNRNSKALTISFHGLPGTGKNYVSDIIMKNIFPKFSETGKSRFVHKFNSRIQFPDEKQIHTYRNQLRDWIISNVTACDKAFFIFDEVDKFPKGLLDVIKPFVDHHASFNRVSFENAVFIFLSNAGGKEIMERFFNLKQAGWITSGKSRSDLRLNDFEQEIKIMAYNHEGGFKASDVIGHNVIDHYVPFLPLEKEHVVKCIRNEYNYAASMYHQLRSKISFEELVKYVMDGMTFIPDPEKLFSSTGCKRVKAKVGTYLSRTGFYI